MYVDKFRDHFETRTAERLSIFLRSEEEKAYVLKCVNENSTFIKDEFKNKCLLFTKMYDKFCTVVVYKPTNELVTIIPCQIDSFTKKRFERTHEKNLLDETVQCYVAWRMDKIIAGNSWKQEPPKLFSNRGYHCGP